MFQQEWLKGRKGTVDKTDWNRELKTKDHLTLLPVLQVLELQRQESGNVVAASLRIEVELTNALCFLSWSHRPDPSGSLGFHSQSTCLEGELLGSRAVSIF